MVNGFNGFTRPFFADKTAWSGALGECLAGAAFTIWTNMCTVSSGALAVKAFQDPLGISSGTAEARHL